MRECQQNEGVTKVAAGFSWNTKPRIYKVDSLMKKQKGRKVSAAIQEALKKVEFTIRYVERKGKPAFVLRVKTIQRD